MLLCLDFESDTPIYLQIRNQIVIGIANGELLDGEKLPTIRMLANDLGINMMTVSKAYQLLKSEGYIYGDRRNGACVRKLQQSKPDTEPGAVLSADSAEKLKLIISEAKLNGVPSEEFLQMCKGLYESIEEENI